MALRDWHGWQIGTMWGIGIALAWLVGRLGVTAVRAVPRVVGDSTVVEGARVSAGGAPLWTTGIVLLIVTILLIITVKWVKASILDQ